VAAIVEIAVQVSSRGALQDIYATTLHLRNHVYICSIVANMETSSSANIAYNVQRYDDLSGLAAIHEAEVNIAICQRNLPNLTDQALALAGVMGNVSLSGSPAQLIRQLEYHPDLSGHAALQHDITMLVRQFAELTGAETLRLLLATVNTNMCRRFHTDMNDLRLLCTYTGPGTLLLPEEAADRRTFGAGGDNDRIVRDHEAIIMAGETDVVVLKGALYPKDGTKAAIHRSPTVEETGRTRLLLRIDTNAFLSL